MSDSRVQQLLEEMLQSERTPEEVCGGDARMLSAVRAEWQRCQQLNAQLDDLFPPADALLAAGANGRAAASSDADPLPVIPGYTAEAVLGRGGMGVVYRARHLRLRRSVALKMLLSGAYAGHVERARFLREAQVVASLQHAHVVQVHDVGEHEGRPFLTMELMDGGSLAERLGGVPQPAADAAETVAILAGAVEAAHRVGIVHRDLKPANILLTADGTPKVCDFGLALLAGGDTDGEAALTISGARLGTPSYMAPEQAAGRRAGVGPATDVYALGAILYEMLTGRPPFRGGSAIETERQVIAEEPVAPSRLRPGVPRDLETVCLKCLSKDPAARYASAAALAADLGRFARGEPVVARRAGMVDRAAKWVRRRPAVAALWAGGTLLLIAACGGAAWWTSERVAAAREVEVDLVAAVQLQREAQWERAKALLDRAELGLRGRALGDLRDRAARVRRDAELVDRLDAIRMSAVKLSHDPAAPSPADADYEAAFRAGGYWDDGGNAEAFAARIRGSNVGRALADGLYDWLRRIPWYLPDRYLWLTAAALQADPVPDATGWRRRAFDHATWHDAAAGEAVMEDPAAAGQSPALLLALVDRVVAARRDPLPLLHRAQQAHPMDFWVNFELVRAHKNKNNLAEAIRFGQAAVALRPDAALARRDLGEALADDGRIDEALEALREALRLDPQLTSARFKFARVLNQIGRCEEAAGEIEAVLRAAPYGSTVQFELADCYQNLERLDAAAAIYRELVQTNQRMLEQGEKSPVNVGFNVTDEYRRTLARARESLRAVLVRQGRVDEVLSQWRAEIDAQGRTEERAWAGYAECCLFVGNTDEYRRACPLLLDRAEASKDPRVWEVAGRACLLLPLDEPDLARAIRLIDRAVAADRTSASGFGRHFAVAKGLAELRGGRFESAIAVMQGEAAGVHGPMPPLVVAMARSRLGHAAEARRDLARAIQSFDWSPRRADISDHWMYHVLRREAEGLILPDLPAFLRGAYEPRDTDERLAMTGACQFMERHAARARLWAEAFDADPALAARDGREQAVLVAALAGSGRGKDAATQTEAARARWRELARQWFHDELSAASDTKGPDAQARQARAKNTLARWLTAPELAPVRNPADLARLPAEEQRDWQVLWRRAATVATRAR